MSSPAPLALFATLLLAFAPVASADPVADAGLALQCLGGYGTAVGSAVLAAQSAIARHSITFGAAITTVAIVVGFDVAIIALMAGSDTIDHTGAFTGEVAASPFGAMQNILTRERATLSGAVAAAGPIAVFAVGGTIPPSGSYIVDSGRSAEQALVVIVDASGVLPCV